MTKALRSFFNALSKQEKLFQAELASDNLGIAPRAAINELDWYAYNMTRVSEASPEQQEQFYILSLGVARLIKLALDACPSYDVSVISFPRTRAVTTRVLECASGLGMIQHGRRVAQYVSSGRADIEQTGEQEFVITLSTTLYDEDSLDSSIFEYYINHSRREFDQLLSGDYFQDVRKEVESLLRELVYPFGRHFIGYGADPVLDAYFLGVAQHRIQCLRGYDSFRYDLKFGGVEFQKYVFALIFVTAVAIRHERFAEALAEKEERSQVENLLTISVDVEPFIESLREVVNTLGQDRSGFEKATPKHASTIFKVLSVDRESTDLLDRPGCELPPFVRVSCSGAIRCQAAALHNPMQFLLDALRWHFPEDYSKNQTTRERSMQAAVKRVMTEAFDDLLFRPNVKLRSDGKILTDVDLIIAEPMSGLVLFVQLKHQDMYGTDLHAEMQRKDRLRIQVNKWLLTTSEWIKASSRKSLSSALRLPKNFPEPLVRRLIITRHFTGNMRDEQQVDSPLSASWEVFYNAVQLARQNHPEPVVNDVLTYIERCMTEGAQRTHLPEPESEWVIGDLRFVTRQTQTSGSDLLS